MCLYAYNNPGAWCVRIKHLHDWGGGTHAHLWHTVSSLCSASESVYSMVKPITLPA